MNIIIADVRFSISCKDVPLVEPPRADTYAPFIVDTMPNNKEFLNFGVSIELDNLPSVGKSTKIFQTPDSWSLYNSGDEYFWTGTTVHPEKGFSCIARFHRRPHEVTIHCGDILVTEEEGTKMLMNPFSYQLDQFLLVYALAEREGALLHACAVELSGKGYVFPGRSGAGKSTISGIFVSRGHSVLSDDRAVVRKIGDAFRVFGTPWSGTAGIAENRSLPLNGIFFIVHGEENKVEKLSPKEAFERLMPVTSILWYDAKVLPSMLSFCEDLAMNIPAYDLHFRPQEEVVGLLERMTDNAGC